ncbi:MAG: class I SAM-dependent DNA methyltransferase [Candidatus Poribacteria bacterium]|nr:class I SAM-dependent DNA methyltransferase [Candidatus Poribacteria bacterium]
MDAAQHSAIVNFIWGVADDFLRDNYSQGKYRDVILPMTVIRRLDCLLEDTKQAVMDRKRQLDEAGILNQAPQLRSASGHAFYNISPFTLRDLTSRTRQQQLKADFITYLDGFSENVKEILNRFRFHNQIDTLVDADILGGVIERFVDPAMNLSPKPVLDADGNVIRPGLDNHSMGTIFEELIRRFNEQNNEEAGEHFTPRDVVKLMANLIYLPVADHLESGTYLVYDGACGTGGMLTVAEETLQALAQQRGKQVSIHLYGQETNAETYAICKSDLLLKGEGDQADKIAFGSTLSADAFPSDEFDFMLSNPPYGKSWKADIERMGGKKGLTDPRFVVSHDGDSEFNLVTRSSDGQLMFLVNKLSKMKRKTELGSRIAQVHNGSSLFTGDAGQGESNIRRWIIENDWLEAIIALPENMFYNTGIATYIWVLTNRKAEHRRGNVQLIDATGMSEPLRKNLGNKNCELTDEHVKRITDVFLAFEETEQSKIFENAAFGYWKVTVERPLRLSVALDDASRRRFRRACVEAKDESLADLIDRVAASLGDGPHLDFNAFLDAVERTAKEVGEKLPAKRVKMLRDTLAERDVNTAPVVRKTSRPSPNDDPQRDALEGRSHTMVNGKPVVMEYEPDTELRDTEQVPLTEDGGIEAFVRREVLPYAPDAWVDTSKTVIGYEISFTRYFYKPQALRSLEEIRVDILALEQETEGLLEQIVGGE